MLKVWNVFLIVTAFALAVFGTFLTRSGVISSVHAFAESNIGAYLIAAVAIILIVSCALIVYRLPELRSAGRLDSLISREASFLLNNLLLVAMAFAIFWGTVFPLVAAAVRGVKVSVGPPFFEAVVTPMGIALLGLIGVCPLLAWRKASPRNLRRNFVIPGVGGAISLAALTFLSRGRHVASNLVLSLAVFVAVTIAVEWARGVRAARASRHQPRSIAFFRLFSKNPRRYGGYVIHFGVVILLAGVVLHVSYKEQHRQSVRVGQSATVGDYSVRLQSLREEETPAKYSVIGMFEVSDAATGKPLGTVRAEKNMFANQEQPTTEVGIRSTVMSDLYVILESADPSKQVASVALLINPGVFWIWAGALILLGGGAIVARPARKARREKEAKDEGPPQQAEPAGVRG